MIVISKKVRRGGGDVRGSGEGVRRKRAGGFFNELPGSLQTLCVYL